MDDLIGRLHAAEECSGSGLSELFGECRRYLEACRVEVSRLERENVELRGLLRLADARLPVNHRVGGKWT